MADISVIIDVLGAEDMEKAARVTQTLQNKIQSLGKQLQKGNITNSQYQKGVQQLIKKNAVAAGGYKTLQSQVQKYAFSMQRQINETKKAAVAQNAIQQEVAQTTAVTKGATAANHAYAQSATMTGKRTNRMGVMMQQTGYQVGDFAVQVQSGTHYMVALGQQATQLVGTMGMLSNSTKMIGLFAGLGIVVPILTAVAGAWLRAKDSAEDFEDATLDVNEAAKSATNELKEYRTELAKLTSEYETLGEVGLEKQITDLEAEIGKLEGRRESVRRAALQGFGASAGRMSAEELERLVAESIKDQNN